MKICLLMYRANPYSGGQGIYLKYIAEEMVRQGHEVHAVVGPPYPMEMKGVIVHKLHCNEYFVKKGNEIVDKKSPFAIFKPFNFYEWLSSRLGGFPEISLFATRGFKFLRNLHYKYNFDIIHDNQSLGYGLLLLKSLGIPVVATIHHPLSVDMLNVLERAGSFRKKRGAIMFYPLTMQRIVSRRLDHVITVSEDSKKRNFRDFGVPLEKQTIVYNGIDRDVFKLLENNNKKDKQLLFVGNSEDGKKGLVFLLKAMALINKEIKLIVVDGGTPHRKISSIFIKKLGLEDRVSFTGKVSMEDLVKYYNESTITIVPSVYEGFGFPAAEAMACKCAVISSDGGALPEVVGDAGIVFPVRDYKKLAEEIESLIKDKSRLKELEEKGYKRVCEVFNWSTAVNQMIDVFQNSIDKNEGVK